VRRVDQELDKDFYLQALEADGVRCDFVDAQFGMDMERVDDWSASVTRSPAIQGTPR
jgi:hypothetical protein